MNKTDKKGGEKDEKYLGVLYTGYLDKRNPVTGGFKKRFGVLTHDAMHWFKRAEGYDLFGEERGHIPLADILTTRILDEDSAAFEVQSTDNNRRLFRCNSSGNCEEWVTALRSAMNKLKRAAGGRRGSLTGMEKDEETTDATEVTVLLVSLLSATQELVIARQPEYGHVITISAYKETDQIIISTSNGGSITLNWAMIQQAEGGIDIALTGVPIASSLRLSTSLSTFSLPVKGKGQEVIYMICRDRALGISVVLSVMVLLSGLRSLSHMSSSLLLLLLFSSLLAIYTLYSTLEHCSTSQSISSSVLLTVHCHTFTSPDVPIDTETPIPKRFIDGCNGDLKEARQRYDVTCHWRDAEGINTILQEPQPYFFLIKNLYPHYHCGRGREGHVVFYERPGEFESSQLAARGVTTDHLVRHWLFTTEYQWQILCKGDETAKSIAVIDLAGMSMGDLAGDNMTYLKKTISIANQHYPERSYVIFVINAPYFFSLCWKIVKPMVHENTQKKVRILSSKDTLRGLQEHIDISQIPAYYGGGMTCDEAAANAGAGAGTGTGGTANSSGGVDNCRFYCEDSLAITDYVKKLNEGTVTSKVPFDQETPQQQAQSSSPRGGRRREDEAWSTTSATTVGPSTPQQVGSPVRPFASPPTGATTTLTLSQHPKRMGAGGVVK